MFVLANISVVTCHGGKHAENLDGPAIAVELGGAPVRMSADWRFRVAGDANPSSGPALTVSTGF